ncbi:hypothetical protein V9K67_27095, partial [Paraflavisolibacter sp. H34]|uniref:hypothetical protein n=1 Tax=Huijunlia imazamoxiresistens TaxID=3127457 RepID=UPI00301A52E8
MGQQATCGFASWLADGFSFNFCPLLGYGSSATNNGRLLILIFGFNKKLGYSSMATSHRMPPRTQSRWT